MSQQWEVTYTVYEDSSRNFSLPNMFNLTMVVQAMNNDQATRIVESMFPNCRVQNAVPLF